MSISSAPAHETQHTSRTAPRVPQTPTPGLGLDSIAPGLGTQSIPDELVKVVDQRRFAATVDVDGEHLNVAYTDSDDLPCSCFLIRVLPSSVLRSCRRVNRRLNAATQFVPADESTGGDSSTVTAMEINRNSADDDAEEGKGRPKKNSAFQTGSEVDRRLRLMLFLRRTSAKNIRLRNLRNVSLANRSPMTS